MLGDRCLSKKLLGSTSSHSKSKLTNRQMTRLETPCDIKGRDFSVKCVWSLFWKHNKLSFNYFCIHQVCTELSSSKASFHSLPLQFAPLQVNAISTPYKCEMHSLMSCSFMFANQHVGWAQQLWFITVWDMREQQESASDDGGNTEWQVPFASELCHQSWLWKRGEKIWYCSLWACRKQSTQIWSSACKQFLSSQTVASCNKVPWREFSSASQEVLVILKHQKCKGQRLKPSLSSTSALANKITVGVWSLDMQ